MTVKQTIKIDLSAFDSEIDKLIDEIIDVGQDLHSKYNKQVYYRLRFLAREVIDDFYDSYNPRVYDRNYDLYNAFQVHTATGVWKIWWSSNLMISKHHQSNFIVYNNAFLHGWHGGSGGTDRNGITVPKSEPHYRVPVGEWSNWGAVAANAGFSPENRIDQVSKQYMKESYKNMAQEFEKKIRPQYNKVVAMVMQMV